MASIQIPTKPSEIVDATLRWMRRAAALLLLLMVLAIVVNAILGSVIRLSIPTLGYVELAYLAGAYWLTK